MLLNEGLEFKGNAFTSATMVIAELALDLQMRL